MSTGYGASEVADDQFQTANYGNGAGGEDFSMDTEGVNGEALGKGYVDKAGTYHFSIEDATDEFTDTQGGNAYWRPNVSLKCVVLHSVAGQSPAGSIHYHRVRFPYPSDKNVMVGKDPAKQSTQYDLTRQELLEFLLGLGILIKKLNPATGTSEIVDPATGSTKIAHQTLASRLKGMQFIGKIKHRSYTPDKGKNAGVLQNIYEFAYGRGCSQVDAVENADTPMNLDALKAIGKARAVLPTAPPPSAKKAAAGGGAAATAAPAANHAPAAHQAAPTAPAAAKPAAAIVGLDEI